MKQTSGLSRIYKKRTFRFALAKAESEISFYKFGSSLFLLSIKTSS